MKAEVNEKFFAVIEQEGTIMDYMDGEFCFVFKDSFWCEHEIKGLQKKPCEFHFGTKYDIPFFLLTIEDAIDTSDFIFNPHECDAIQELLAQEVLKGTIYLVDKENIVRAKKAFQLSSKLSESIKNELQRVLSQPYMEAEFQCNLEGIYNTWEPFELAEQFKLTCKL